MYVWNTKHTLAIGAERTRVRTVHKLLGRRTRYPAYGAGPVREFTDYGTRARARTLPSASYSREALPHPRAHTHTDTMSICLVLHVVQVYIL